MRPLIPFLLLVSIYRTECFSAETHHSTPLQVPAGGHAGFALLPPRATGIQFTNALAQSRYTTNQIYLNGSGVAAGDVDGDGWCDVYFCSLSGANALYRNLGNWHFTNITESAGVGCAGLSSTGAAFADLDGDGDLDLIVNTIGGGTQIFLNDGKGHFKRSAVLNEGKGGMSLALADIDGNGTLDLYLCNYRTVTLRDQPQTNFRVNMVNGKPVIAAVNGEPATLPKYEGRFALNASGNVSEFGEVDGLYRNDGHGGFTLVPFTGGAFLDENNHPLTAPPYDWSLSVMFRDIDGDGRPDIYVCNDFETPDCIWINQGGGHFRALPHLALRNTSKFSMGVDFADINRDGHDDILVLDMMSRSHVTRLTRADKNMEITLPGVIDNRPQFTRNTLQLNRGDQTYAEIAYFAGLEASEWSWTPIFLDVDLDGYEDVLITAGHGRDDMDIDNGLRIERTRRTNKMTPAAELAMRLSSPALPAPKLAFRNSGRIKFEESGADWNFNQTGISHGMCLADLDNDGDLDVIVNNLNDAAGIYRNESSAPRVAVRLRGASENTRGIGAKIKVLGGAVPVQTQEMICGGRYLSSDDAVRVFAAGTVTNLMRVEVTWPGGKKSVLENVRANTACEVLEAGALPNAISNEIPPAPLFQDAGARLEHTHHEEQFDDFARQTLLPNRLSQLGPAVCWVDLDQDGRDDLVIGTGRGGSVAVFRNEMNRFVPMRPGALTAPAPRDTAGIVGYATTNGARLLIALSNYEDGSTNGSCLREFDARTGAITDILPTQISSSGALAVADVDGDGVLELFVGGRVIPAKYPERASSVLLRRQHGNWVRDPTSNLLTNIGLVSGALFSDLNGDGYPELILACEWGPLRIFANEKGRLREATRDWRMDQKIGWWNGVAAGDFDGDGRIDLIASNWGLNSKYRVNAGHGPRLYYGAWGGAGEIEPIEASFDTTANRWMPERDLNWVGRALPGIREKFRSHRGFAQASIEDILGPRLGEAGVLEVNCLESTVFLNRGDHFEAKPLPDLAQFAPAFGINVADFDGDGREDIFVSQNFFAVQAQTSRNDAGRGLLLRGDGAGSFEPMDGARSGIRVYGEQRGSAAADYDGDGRVDLVVSQNGAATTLWHNTGAKPGMRVRLVGPAENRSAIGAIMRVAFGKKFGPAREIHAGSGYWSQDSATQVMATPEEPTSVEVLWPGGRHTLEAIPPGTRAIRVEYPSGKVSAE